MIFLYPHTEATKDVRPAISAYVDERATISSPAGLRFSEDFVAKLSSAGFTAEPLDPKVATSAMRFLRSVYVTLPDVAPPTIGQGVDGCLGMTWETATDHVNVEFFPDGHIEYFHEDLVTGALWNVEDVKSAVASRALLERLAQMA